MSSKASKHDNLIGRKLGDYEIMERLASGGMASIYIGLDTKLERKAAVKILTPDMTGDDDTLAIRFEREARAVAALEHENIITIYQFGQDEGIYYLAMKYIQGNDLAVELKRLRREGTKMPVDYALNILGQVAAALDHAHAHGIIHRDVKPSNILLENNGKATLTDFGLVLRSTADTTLGTAFGTPRYISPEQAMASERAVSQSDTYSLAVIVFEILTGEVMFKGATPMEIAISHINEPPPKPRSINPDIPQRVEDELLRALDKIPENRHNTATELISAIKQSYNLAAPDAVLADKTDAELPTPIKRADKTPAFGKDEMEEAVAAHVDRVESARAKGVADNVVVSPLKAGDHTATIALRERPRRGVIARLTRALFHWAILLFIIAALGLVVVATNPGLLDSFLPASAPTTNGAGIVVVAETPTDAPTATTAPTDLPTDVPTAVPTDAPTQNSPDTAVPTDAATTVPTDVPTAAPTTAPTIPPTSSGAIPVNGIAMTIVYNATAFALRNDGEVPVDLTTLVIERGTTRLSGSQITGSRLQADECVVMLLQQQNVSVPAEWDCGDSTRTQISVPDVQSMFWRTVGDETTFHVLSGADEIVVCDTVGRGAAPTTCAFRWAIPGS